MDRGAWCATVQRVVHGWEIKHTRPHLELKLSEYQDYMCLAVQPEPKTRVKYREGQCTPAEWSHESQQTALVFQGPQVPLTSAVCLSVPPVSPSCLWSGGPATLQLRLFNPTHLPIISVVQWPRHLCCLSVCPTPSHFLDSWLHVSLHILEHGNLIGHWLFDGLASSPSHRGLPPMACYQQDLLIWDRGLSQRKWNFTGAGVKINQ